MRRITNAVGGDLPFADLAGPLQTVLNSFFIMNEITHTASVGCARELWGVARIK